MMLSIRSRTREQGRKLKRQADHRWNDTLAPMHGVLPKPSKVAGVQSRQSTYLSRDAILFSAAWPQVAAVRQLGR